MNRLNTATRAAVVRSLVEGNSISSTVRMTGISKPTILKLIVDLGEACQRFHDEKVRNLTCEAIQSDELWAFCGSKARNVPPERRGEFGRGDVWTWTAICATSKLMISWIIGTRDAGSANEIMTDVAGRLDCRVQLTSDGFHAYMNAVANAFGVDGVDYAQLHKIYRTNEIAPGRYSPPICIGARIKPCLGDPDGDKISTSFIERSNLTVRMGIRRYTRLTNGFSKKVENHAYMTSIFFTYYNWCRKHQTLGKQTPAMAAGLTDRVWAVEDLVGLINQAGK